MALWTDLIDPAELSGYARESLAEYEARSGTLARWLPNREVADIIARFVKGAAGLIPVAMFRAFDAEPEMGARPGGGRVLIELPALGLNIPVSEYDQLRSRGGEVSDQATLDTIYSATDVVVRAVADRIEQMRGVVLVTGKATINQSNFVTEDDFGRAAGHTVTAPALWSVAATDAIGQIQGWVDTYVTANGEEPGAMVGNRRVIRALAKLDQFKTGLIGGASRPASLEDVNGTLISEGLPPFIPYNRLVNTGTVGTPVATKVVADDKLLLLPAPVEDTSDWMGSQLGATFWGRTLTSQDGEWNIETDEQPGLVAGVYKHPKPPMGLEVISDAIGLPVLANANLSFTATVL
mgnify:CR=1 FL=1